MTTVTPCRELPDRHAANPAVPSSDHARTTAAPPGPPPPPGTAAAPSPARPSSAAPPRSSNATPASATFAEAPAPTRPTTSAPSPKEAPTSPSTWPPSTARHATPSRRPPRPPALEPDRIVVSLRNTPASGRVRTAKSREVILDLAGWASALTELRSHLGVPIRFVAFDPGRDGPGHSRLADLIGDCEIAEVDQESAPAEMKRSVVAVVGRYHAAVLAALFERPVVALDQGMKLPALTSMIGSGSVAVPESVSGDGLCRSVDAAIAGAPALPQAIARMAAEADAHGEAIRLLIEESR